MPKPRRKDMELTHRQVWASQMLPAFRSCMHASLTMIVDHRLSEKHPVPGSALWVWTTTRCISFQVLAFTCNPVPLVQRRFDKCFWRLSCLILISWMMGMFLPRDTCPPRILRAAEQYPCNHIQGLAFPIVYGTGLLV